MSSTKCPYETEASQQNPLALPLTAFVLAASVGLNIGLADKAYSNEEHSANQVEHVMCTPN